MDSRFQILATALAFGLIALKPDHAQGEGPIRPVVLDDGVIKGQIPYLILPQVKCKDADLPGALEYLRKIALRESKGAVKLTYVMKLPEDFRPQSELTLELAKIPLREALRFLGELAGVQFTQQGDAWVVQKRGAAPAKLEPQAQPTATSAGGAAVNNNNRLNKGPEREAAGNNAYRSLDGTLQNEKSGYVPHRSMSGFPTAQDPKNQLSVDCVRPSMCPKGDCGCKVCACGGR